MNPALPLVKQIMQQAIKQHATDLHFLPSQKETNIHFRIQGKRKLFRTIPTNQYELLLTFFKFTAGMDIGESKKPQDGSIANIFPNLGKHTLRLSTLPLLDSESLAIRILPQEDSLPLDELFLFPYQLNKLKELASARSGLFLITGPAGSGKSTTLYALIHFLMKEHSFQAVTLEDPVERQMDDVIQVQINEQAGITYQAGLKAALRHDPDLLMVGELRDESTAHFALQSSLTGHLVLSTLHARNAVGTIYRLLDMGIKQQDLLQSLIAVASIQLIPIQHKGTVRRAAILELLEGDKLNDAIQTRLDIGQHGTNSFDHLRRKAYAYGFSPEAFRQETTKIT
ncbi:competence type IV pilus ATPase ComGA [Oceanobacillus indicireducens]|uniref:Competence protein ComG n=1 Tax=Oceanobacillus indicireducens TaxID=1004261 RepID=A0A917Y3I3_9BACI|nr:competence type IV pilus ATPase ComGA [Oceanobacillus indicireducens]GGN63912.1 competence protein ComG [Oceanobacillus indicireducens]